VVVVGGALVVDGVAFGAVQEVASKPSISHNRSGRRFMGEA
jgi:hypothetical protein